ncbi:MAG: protein kinase [Gammaproteobacteria bacterium]|jgi:serine/threonine-protein kinase|nr:protein kinase [Gammaproteobacteria bacterium]
MAERPAADRYREAKAIAFEALDLAPGEREAFVASRCADDADLRREVDWLIAAGEDDSDDDVPESFQSAARSALRDVSLEVPLPRNYRLLRRLSQGGMGIVYLAERVDGDIRQQVAFKLLHLSESDNQAVARRFATERGILSRLNHPWIAHLIDGGLTAEGRPFLATEYVDGERIDRWCSQRELGTEQRIELFLKVCEAVDYAHRHMVIHRDLKPSNIMVTDAGEPKLLDFGVARLLDAEEQAAEGGAGQAQGLTLAYASPEQIEGRGLSAATDVYSLGVLLYELVAGHGPFTGLESEARLREAVLAGDWPAPSERGGGVEADVEAIIARAMHREVDGRYDSVRALAEDLRRYLAHRPVRARDGGAVYRAGRFIRRHRLALAVGVGMLSLLVAFLADREMQIDRIAWERDRAEAVTRFMNELFAGADSLPSRGNEVTVREILDLGTRQLERTGADNPAMLGSMYLALGQAYNGLGLGEQALPLLERAREVLASRSDLAASAMIEAELAAAYDSAGRAADAIAADERAIDLFERAPGDHDDSLLRSGIRKLRNHANVLDIPLEEVVVGLEAIIAELEARAGADPELLFEAKAALVGAQVVGRNAEQAVATAAEVRDLAERLYRDGDPRRLRGRYVYATALMLRDPESAVAMFEDLIADHERMVGPSQRLANTIGNFGVALSRIGRTRESMDSFARAAEMIERTVGRDHYLFRLSMTNLAALRLRAGEAQEAERLIRDILPELESRHLEFGGVETRYWASALEVLAGAELMQGRADGAASRYRAALAVLEGEGEEEWPALRARIAGKLDQLDGR